MRVVFVAAECEPWAKTGGLADVVDALARSLGRIEAGPSEPIEVFLPRYRGIVDCADTQRLPLRVSDPFAVEGVTEVTIASFDADGYRLRLVEHDPAFDRDGYYGDVHGDYPDNAWRFGLFCQAVLATIRHDAAAGRPVDVLHLHDWHAAPAVIFRDAATLAGPDDPAISRLAVVHTLHNLAYHGWVSRDALGQLGLHPGDGIVARDADGLDLLASGVNRSELVNTVSATYAREALTPEFGFGLDGALRKLGDRFFGILNGLDTSVWDPAAEDEALAARYSAADRNGKRACRADLLTRLGFDPDDESPVLGMIGRLDPQKGFDLVADAAPDLLALGARIVVQGAGDPRLAGPFRALMAKEPARVALIERFDRAMARRIYAGADFFLMPSRFEPSGQGQMIALRYGTPPIARATGGLVDSIVDETEHPGAGTGFLFEAAASAALVAACRRAFDVRGRDGTSVAWNQLLDRGMAVDFSWEGSSAPAYAAAYERAVELRQRVRSEALAH